ncbi:hypothetical protein HYZ06_00480 [Candidatus Daviesbacteria bacterium]|nr:hypothetical protein [Candidatus Daviesbacteria bacterium]
MPALHLIERARNSLLSRAQEEAAARDRIRKASAVDQLYGDMFSDCMRILEKANDPTPLYRRIPVYKQVEQLMVRMWGIERTVSSQWEDGAGPPITVALTGWPLHRDDPYATLQVEGLREKCYMWRDPQANRVRGNLTVGKERSLRSLGEGEVTIEQVQHWREIVDFLKG